MSLFFSTSMAANILNHSGRTTVYKELVCIVLLACVFNDTDGSFYHHLVVIDFTVNLCLDISLDLKL